MTRQNTAVVAQLRSIQAPTNGKQAAVAEAPQQSWAQQKQRLAQATEAKRRVSQQRNQQALELRQQAQQLESNTNHQQPDQATEEKGLKLGNDPEPAPRASWILRAESRREKASGPRHGKRSRSPDSQRNRDRETQDLPSLPRSYNNNNADNNNNEVDDDEAFVKRARSSARAGLDRQSRRQVRLEKVDASVNYSDRNGRGRREGVRITRGR
ncbi:hypothetical protein HKX48_001686 [Thoreauomyces humboldtii]|nr:hypothetical protein HKX48_001686 [Thoreauomyces humboldtii]